MICLMRVRLGRNPETGELQAQVNKRALIVENWHEILEDITEFEVDAYQCWSITIASNGQPILVLFANKALHPHYTEATT